MRAECTCHSFQVIDRLQIVSRPAVLGTGRHQGQSVHVHRPKIVSKTVRPPPAASRGPSAAQQHDMLRPHPFATHTALRAAKTSIRLHVCRVSSGTTSTTTSSIRGPPCFTLEASVGAANPLDLQLLSTGAFGAEVHPDLPIATTWWVSRMHACTHAALSSPVMRMKYPPLLPCMCRHGLYKQLALKFGAGAARKEAAAAAATSITAAAAAAAMSESAAEAEAALAFAGARPVMHIATVGAQLRSLEDTAEAMCWAAGVTPSGHKLPEEEHRPHADALLLVSGSHPVRQLPMASQLLTGSVGMLQRGTQLKQQGVLPPQLELWAVANPVTERDASYTEQKVGQTAQCASAVCGQQQAEQQVRQSVSSTACSLCQRATKALGAIRSGWNSPTRHRRQRHTLPCAVPCCVSLLRWQVAAGAQVILTQPPLDWPAFELWMEDARRRGLHTTARLLVGFPCLSSASNAGFWLALCNAGNNAEVRHGACAAASRQCPTGQRWRRVGLLGLEGCCHLVDCVSS